jgi:hypothetical protein
MKPRVVDINAQNVDGDTALHVAISQNRFDSAIHLKISGADENIHNMRGFPARKGQDGKACYGVCAMASAKTIEMVELAFKICDSNFDDLDTAPLRDAVSAAQEAVGDRWTETHDILLASLVSDIERNKITYVHDSSTLNCNSENGILQSITCA